MYRALGVFFCIIFVVGINGAWIKQPASIDENAVELTQLTEKFWSLKPTIFKRTKPVVYCQIIDQCCDDEDRLEAVSLMSQYIDGTDRYSFAEVLLTCMNSTTAHEENQLCSSIIESIIPLRITYQNSDVQKYIHITNKYDKLLDNLLDYILSTCNSEEIYALLCLSNEKLVKTCAGRILQNIYDDHYKSYEAVVMYTKQVLIDLNQQLSEALITNTNIK
jgi:hypothetical protein